LLNFFKVFVIIAFSAALKIGDKPWLMFAMNFGAMATYFTAHWQTYVTGSLKFEKFDVTEAQLTVYTIHILTAFFGHELWQYTVKWKLIFIKRHRPSLNWFKIYKRCQIN